jgi:hypothetical protein
MLSLLLLLQLLHLRERQAKGVVGVATVVPFPIVHKNIEL